MSVIEMKVPTIGESITEVTLSQWLKKDGDFVNIDEPICEFESDKATLEFPAECKKALVASHPQRLLDFIQKECNGDAILKPLHLFGGKGIIRVELAKVGLKEAHQILLSATDQGTQPKLAQAFDKGIFDGEVRAFLVNGCPLSWCLKVPQNGSFLANTAAGAVLKSYSPSSELVAKVTRVAENLKKRGVIFIGLDIINEEISEINITSPRLLVAPGDTRDYYAQIASFLETW